MTLNIPHSLCFLTKVDTFSSSAKRTQSESRRAKIKIQQNMIVLSPERRRTAASLISPARVILIFRPTMHLLYTVGFYQNVSDPTLLLVSLFALLNDPSLFRTIIPWHEIRLDIISVFDYGMIKTLDCCSGTFNTCKRDDGVLEITETLEGASGKKFISGVQAT